MQLFNSFPISSLLQPRSLAFYGTTQTGVATATYVSTSTVVRDDVKKVRRSSVWVFFIALFGIPTNYRHFFCNIECLTPTCLPVIPLQFKIQNNVLYKSFLYFYCVVLIHINILFRPTSGKTRRRLQLCCLKTEQRCTFSHFLFCGTIIYFHFSHSNSLSIVIRFELFTIKIRKS